ncbi:MAG: hypothetical protein CMF59_17470 [Leptospiraceae bacterium]|nr:hypothetical protein [Leptospiraceae bacterium]
MKIKLRYPVLALGILAFFAGIYAYISMNIEASLLEREIRLARYEKRDWERKNSAIRAEVARLEGEGYETIYWKLYGALPFYEDNTIIYVDLDSLRPGPGFYKITPRDDMEEDLDDARGAESEEPARNDNSSEPGNGDNPDAASVEGVTPDAGEALESSAERFKDWFE